jgi:cystatin-11
MAKNGISGYFGEFSVNDTMRHSVRDFSNVEATVKREDVTLHLFASYHSQVTDHMEYHITVEMQRTTCLKSESSNCAIQKGELRKVHSRGENSFLVGFSMLLG